MAHMKFSILMAMFVASASAQFPGMGGGFPGMGSIGDIFKMASDMANTAIEQSMSIFKAGVDLVPMKEAMAMSQAALKSATDYPQKIMEILTKAAGSMTQLAGGAANPGAEMFSMAADQVGKLKEADAPKKDYMDLMQKMQAAMQPQG